VTGMTQLGAAALSPVSRVLHNIRISWHPLAFCVIVMSSWCRQYTYVIRPTGMCMQSLSLATAICWAAVLVSQTNWHLCNQHTLCNWCYITCVR
jgi:hypothetical protein